jgi:protein-disulfide isomerase
MLAQHSGPVSVQQTVVATAPTRVPERVVLGSVTAPLGLTWYTDVRSAQSPTQGELIRSLARRYEGKVRVVFKAYPLATHQDGRLAAAALVAASAQDKFWPMYDAITAHKETLDRDNILSIVDRLHMDTAAFVAGLDAAPAAVQTDFDEGQRRGVLGAPVIFLNDHRIDGLQREAFYTAIADDELKQQPAIQGAFAAPQSLPSAPASIR